MTEEHDPLCPPIWRLDDQVPEDDCPFCRLIAKVESRTLHEIAKVRADERGEVSDPDMEFYEKYDVMPPQLDYYEKKPKGWKR